MNDLWIFNIITMEWEQITQSGMYFIRKRHSTAMVSHFMLMYGGVNEEGKGITDIYALNLNDFKWLACPIAEGEGPGPLTHFSMTTVIHPDRANKKQFSLFKNPAEMKYKAFSKLKMEGVFVFGGRKPNGFASDKLWVLQVGQKPLQWLLADTQGQSPAPRYSHAVHHVEGMNSLVLYGGRNDT